MSTRTCIVRHTGDGTLRFPGDGKSTANGETAVAGAATFSVSGATATAVSPGAVGVKRYAFSLTSRHYAAVTVTATGAGTGAVEVRNRWHNAVTPSSEGGTPTGDLVIYTPTICSEFKSVRLRKISIALGAIGTLEFTDAAGIALLPAFTFTLAAATLGTIWEGNHDFRGPFGWRLVATAIMELEFELGEPHSQMDKAIVTQAN